MRSQTSNQTNQQKPTETFFHARLPENPPPSPHNRLHAQTLQEPTQILLLHLHHTVLKAINPHPGIRLAHHVLERRAKPIQPIPPRPLPILLVVLLPLTFLLALLAVTLFFF